MRRFFVFFASILLTYPALSQTCSTGLSGVYKVGPTGNYPTISAALSVLRANGVSASVILELQAAYTSGSESYPIAFNGISCLSATKTLTIRPEATASNLVITGSNSTAIISYDNARYVIVDGRAGGTGTSKQLRLTNTGSAGAVVRFTNDASYDTLRYVTVTGNAISFGQVHFSTTTSSITNGNSYNDISNCSISGGRCGVYSLGTTGKKNINNTIRNNDISGFAESGISLNKNSEAWKLQGNSIYSTPGSIAMINLNDSTSSGFDISGNYLGGTAPLCGGGYLTASNYFKGILAITGSNGYTTIDNNTIANISEVGTNAYSFAGIHLAMGKFKCGDVQGNMIGSLTNPQSIKFGMNAGGFAEHFEFNGILAGDNYYSSSGVDTSFIRNNKVSGLYAYQYSTGFAGGELTGIRLRNHSRGFVEISNNTIGNPTQFSSIQNASGTYEPIVIGIDVSYSFGNYPVYLKNLVKNNTVCNLNGSCTGIRVQQSAADVINNTIYNLHANYFPTDNGGATGILISNATPGLTVSGNTIRNLNVKTQSPVVSGIIATYASNITIEKNNIHTLQAVGTFNSATFTGIDHNYSATGIIRNNMIRLGIDSIGGQITGDHSFTGIITKAVNSVITHNSVYIGGVGNGGSIAMYSQNYPMTIRNNIFYNAHSSPGSSFYDNYAFRYDGDFINQQGLDYNIYYATGTRGYPGTLYKQYTFYTASTIDQWRAISGTDSSSMFYNPNFANPTGSVTSGNLHLANPTPAEGQGLSDPAVTDDIDGDARSSNTPVDIGADAGNYTIQDGDRPVIMHAAFLGQFVSSPEPFKVKIKDNGGGVDTAGNNKPRMWYRKKTPTITSWVSVAGVLQSGTVSNGIWGFTPDHSLVGGAVIGDSIEYYFVAQDKGPAINIGYSNTTGTLHSNVNTQSSAPTTPLRYIVLGQFPDTVYVGAGQTYTSLTNDGGFFDAAKKTLFRETSTPHVVYITSDLTAETGKHRFTNLNTNQNLIKFATNTAVVKQITHTAALTDALIHMVNAHDIEIDGSVNGSGRYLQFTCANTIATGKSAFIFEGNLYTPVDNIVIRNCIFESNVPDQYNIIKGVVNINAYIKSFLFRNNLIRNIETGPNAGLPMTGLYLGIAKGNNVVVSNNEITNFSGKGIESAQSDMDPNKPLLIDSNHFYRNSSIISNISCTVISQVSYNNAVKITNNYMGGSAPYCAGSPWMYSLPYVNTSQTGLFKGFDLSVSKDSMSVIRNNHISNIQFTAYGYAFYGIYLNNVTSTVDLDGNIIGNESTDSSIVNQMASYGIWVNVAIYTNYRPLILVRNNIIAGMTLPSFEGIHIETYNGKALNNRVKRIRLKTAGFGFKGMKIWLAGAVSGNEVSDIISTYNGYGYAYGIDLEALGPLPDEMIVEKNKVATLLTKSGDLYGISVGNGQYHIRNNTVSLTNSSSPTDTRLYGIYFHDMAGNVFQTDVLYNSVYIGGSSVSALKTYGVYVNGGSPITSFRNNLVYNERSGPGTHIALGVLSGTSPSGWLTPYVPNHNFYITKDTAAINEWTNQGVKGLKAWRNSVHGDSSSLANSSTNIPSASLFVNAPLGDLHINTSNSLAWSVNGKGMPLAGVSGDMDLDSGARSTAVVTGATDIGADEFTTTTPPPPFTITGNHSPGGADTLSMNGRIYAILTWGATGTLPTLGTASLYSGVWPPDSTNNGTAFLARFANSWWNIPATGGSNYSYSLTLFYDSSMLGAITDPSTMLINKKQSGVPGSWITIQPSIVNTAAKTITINNQTSFSQFTITDAAATLQTGVAAPELAIIWNEVNPGTLPTGSSFGARFIEKNTGNSVAGAHKVRIYLSPDNMLTPGLNGDVLLGFHDVTSLAAGATTDTVSKTLQVSCTQNTGAYFILFAADADNQVTEGIETNNINAAPVTVSQGIALPAVPVINSNPGDSICSGNQAILTASSSNCAGCTYQWSWTGGSSSGNILTVTSTGNYQVSATNACGSANASKTITVKPLPTITVTGLPSLVCQGYTYSLQASGAQTYSWNGPGLVTTGSNVNFTPQSTVPQPIIVTGINNGCSNSVTIPLNVKPAVTINAGADTSICLGTSATLRATGNPNTVLWMPNPGGGNNSSLTFVVTPAITTVFTVTGTSIDGCQASDQVTVTVQPSVTPAITITNSGCPGNNLNFNAVTSNAGSSPVIQWYVNGSLTGTGSSFNLTNATNGTQVYAKLTSNAVCANPAVVQSTVTIVNCVATAIPNIQGLQSYSIAPNPAGERFVIKLQLANPKEVSFALADLSGKVVFRSETVRTSGNYQRTVNLNGIAAGIYFIRLQIGNEYFVDKIVVIN